MGSITVTNLGKAYKYYPSRWGRLAEWFGLSRAPRHDLKWVLRDVNFTVNPGEAVGIIGANGAGKSTLLKIITGTTQPTTGRVRMSGRVAAMLELGIGFHPEFTGRQNAIMAGQLLGHSTTEIVALMDAIEAFAGIGEAIDQPVRVYSSGMQMRLAFSVATATRPDVLIVDEALAVGDAAFQRKCFQRIEALLEGGTTLLYVSHDIEGVKKLCDRAIFIKEGEMERFGPAKAVCDAYEKYLFGGKTDWPSFDGEPRLEPLQSFDEALAIDCEMAYGDGRAVIEACWLEDRDGQKINVIRSGEPFTWNYIVRFKSSAEQAVFGMMIKTREGICVYGTNTELLGERKRSFISGECVRVSFRLNNGLVPGVYYLNCGVREDEDEGVAYLHRRVDVAAFKVLPARTGILCEGLADMGAKADISTRTDVLAGAIR